jgi:hypothetical protein
MGIAQGRYCAIGEGFLGRRALVNSSAESRRRPASSSPKDDARFRPSLTEPTATVMQIMQSRTAQTMLDHRGLPCRACTHRALRCQPALARLTVGLGPDVKSRAMHGQRGTAIPTLQDDVVVELDCRPNAQCSMRQRGRELDQEAAPAA